MLKKTVALAVTGSLLGFAGGAFSADPQPSAQERKSASAPKAKKPAKATAKPKTAQGKKKIPRVEEAPDFRASN